MSVFDRLRKLVSAPPDLVSPNVEPPRSTGMSTPPPGIEVVRFKSEDKPLGALVAEELKMLQAVQRGDDCGREVYADWLETQSRHREAEYVRAELVLQRAPKDQPQALTAALDGLRDAGKRVSSEFRAWMSRPSLENCNLRFEVKCPLEWKSLSPTSDAKVRDCSVCHRQVRFCSTVQEAAQVAQAGCCVAVDLGQFRRPGDLEPRPMMMGRVSSRR